MENKLYNVGKIVNTHGIKGEVKIIRITDFDDRFDVGNKLYFLGKNEKNPIQLTVASHRMHKQFDLVQFESYNTIEVAEKLKEGMLMIREEQRGTLDEGDFYYHEIIGCTVYTNENEELGEIKEILAPGANDVWVVTRPNQKDLLIPYIPDVVKEVNIEEKKIIIEPMEGLLD
ncbi:ribosome maturation factor RimM [Paraliobacillus sediminis]|uniref:ribosome maturation factor RimM n=1 Tax=Paraliobacillus sediminis TaxID=1885916 RepID=UPI000E3EBA18|nr:ribosome maturation factor RimM [Paraliobacillus sediminis]